MVRQAETAAVCLDQCGFAVLQGAYEPSMLQRASTAFEQWSADSSQVAQYAVDEGGNTIRGGRLELLLSPELATDSLLYSRPVAQAVRAFNEAAGYAGIEASLDFASFIVNMPGEEHQGWHIDSTYPDGIKVQIPLETVTQQLGPVEIQAAVGVHATVGCPLLVGAAAQGSAILYRHSNIHRGTANRATRNRTVLDLSFMLATRVKKQNYQRNWSPPNQRLMNRYRNRYSALCAADNNTCGTPAETTPIPVQLEPAPGCALPVQALQQHSGLNPANDDVQKQHSVALRDLDADSRRTVFATWEHARSVLHMAPTLFDFSVGNAAMSGSAASGCSLLWVQMLCPNMSVWEIWTGTSKLGVELTSIPGAPSSVWRPLGLVCGSRVKLRPLTPGCSPEWILKGTDHPSQAVPCHKYAESSSNQPRLVLPKASWYPMAIEADRYSSAAASWLVHALDEVLRFTNGHAELSECFFNDCEALTTQCFQSQICRNGWLHLDAEAMEETLDAIEEGSTTFEQWQDTQIQLVNGGGVGPMFQCFAFSFSGDPLWRDEEDSDDEDLPGWWRDGADDDDDDLR